VLSDPQKRRYARQILVDELGLAGQERLCGAAVQPSAAADPEAAAVALDYLARAGLRCEGEPSPLTAAGGPALPVEIETSAAVHALAGDPLLYDCAAWLAGAFAAVETIKRAASAGVEGRLDPALTLQASSAPSAGRDHEPGRNAPGLNREVQ